MLYHDTYDRRIQLGASRRRCEDAEALHNANRWTGAIYLAGYAIECSLKAYICFYEHKHNFKDTKLFKKRGTQGTSLHDLNYLLWEVPPLWHIIRQNEIYRNAWSTIMQYWQKDTLRYWDKLGDQHTSERFLTSVKKMHQLILHQQGETV